MSETRPFVRSRHDRMIGGVVGGFARRFGWSSTLLRVLFVIVSIASAAFPGIIVYLLLWLLMPEEGA
ncbi:PspC domain-containing protein [Lysobacter sp. A3-1-A15]|uniref:PspC domain-containing protein n=1 Tax=Novilysobacter viscosus TaxID=3098602 RepID=UPI002EDA1B65